MFNIQYENKHIFLHIPLNPYVSTLTLSHLQHYEVLI